MGSLAIDWAHAGPTVLAAFLASLVEFVEALTIVLAVGAVRGWRGALGGTGLALLVLLAIVIALGPALTHIPLDFVQLGVGTLILLFGMRWLRKAILRSAGVIPLHDEEATYVKETALLRGLSGIGRGWDAVAISSAFKITMIEGIEVVFIVLALGAASGGLLNSCEPGSCRGSSAGGGLRPRVAPARCDDPRKHTQIRCGFVIMFLWHLLARRRDGLRLAGRRLGDCRAQRRFSGGGDRAGSTVPRAGSAYSGINATRTVGGQT